MDRRRKVWKPICLYKLWDVSIIETSQGNKSMWILSLLQGLCCPAALLTPCTSRQLLLFVSSPWRHPRNIQTQGKVGILKYIFPVTSQISLNIEGVITAIISLIYHKMLTILMRLISHLEAKQINEMLSFNFLCANEYFIWWFCLK